jgi:cytochrome c biogenesis factor
MWIINLLTGLFLIFLGLTIRIFKMSYLIAGYNTASKEEKRKYNEEKLIKYVSNLLMISSAFIIIGGLLSIIFNAIQETIFIGSWLFFTIFIISGVIYLNVSGCVKNKI